MPENLIQVRAYVRWEEAGKPQNTSPEWQKVRCADCAANDLPPKHAPGQPLTPVCLLSAALALQEEFVRARQDLRRELASGLSLNDIRRRYKLQPVPGDDLSPATKVFGFAPPVLPKPGEAPPPQQRSGGVPPPKAAPPPPATPPPVPLPADAPRTDLFRGSVPRRSWDLLTLLPRGGTATDPHGPPSTVSPPPVPALRQLADRDAPPGRVSSTLYTGMGGSPGFGLLVELFDPAPPPAGKAAKAGKDSRMVVLTTDSTQGLTLHWGCSRGDPCEWVLPPTASWLPGSVPNVPLEQGDDQGVQATSLDTPFERAEVDLGGGAGSAALQQLRIPIPAPGPGEGVHGIHFVVRTTDGGHWYKRPGRGGGGNFVASFLLKPSEPESRHNTHAAADAATMSGVAGEIVDVEAGDEWWSLMHRYNLAHELLRRILAPGAFTDAQVVLQLRHMLVWLRYSAQRYLTWQRNYNVKPRELAGAQQQLTLALAAGVGSHPQHGPLLRSMLATMGRGGDGGDGQRIRDEILNIMHRHGIKEAHGTWMEEWHQKLHNNTTPDDIPICAAYLAFLRSGGDQGAYNSTLEAAGVTKERLTSFERPITKAPDWPGSGMAQGLIPDFENYMRILKTVHAGADLDESVRALSNRMSPSLGRAVDATRRGTDAGFVAEAAAESRQELRASLLVPPVDDATRREALYLDAALEDTARRAIERTPGNINDLAGLMRLVGWAAEHAALSAAGSPEAAQYVLALIQWRKIQNMAAQTGGREGTQLWALRAQAAADRFRAALATSADEAAAAMQPFARLLGTACGVPHHAVELFSEEVIRGGAGFALSLALSRLDPALRAAADLGSWAVISPVSCCGRLVVEHDLASVQSKVYVEPTVLVAERVGGGEELPAGCVGLITPSTVDVLSHAAVRARNASACFASCYSEATLQQLRALAGQPVALTVKGSRGVTFAQAAEASMAHSPGHGGASPASPAGAAGGGGFFSALTGGQKLQSLPAVRFGGNWAIPLTQFLPGLVGGKSKNTKALRDRLAAGSLPPDVGLPASIAVPFGAFEAALDDGANKAVKAALGAAVKAIDVSTQSAAEASLAACRAAALQISCPPALRTALTQQLQAAGMPVPGDDTQFASAFAALRAVWASKWNLRAYLSLRGNGIAHDSLRMSVLVQRVVGARYAFVLHTVDPTADTPEEAAGRLYGEVVVGLGETLVGNYPGRALAFSCAKADAGQALAPQVLGFPSKLVALRSDSTLIFRSDSNGEDLEGYAGAGLYDSVLVTEPSEVAVDYSADPLVWDDAFRTAVLGRITEAGLAVEAALGSAQDIEGCVDAQGVVHLVQTRPQV